MASNNTNGRSGSSSRPAAQLMIGTPARVLFSLTLIAGLLALLINAALAQDTTTDLTDDPAATPAATPSAEMPRIELDLEEVNESDLGGKVTLYEFGDRTIVEFEATGSGGGHPAVIVAGVCGEVADETDDPVAELEVVDNQGESVTVVDTSLEDLLAEDHSIEIRMSEDDIDTVIACAFIEGEPSLEPSATPVASPDATPDSTPDATGDEDDDDLDGVGGSATDIDGTSGAANVDANTLTVNLVDWSETGVTGTATLIEDGNITQVNISIDGPGVVGGHEVHIHNGTCATPGTATYTLNPIDANGNSDSSVNLTLTQLTGGNYFINIHPDEANWDDWMVCGNITGTPTEIGSVQSTTPVTNQTGDGSVGGNMTLVTTNAPAGEFPTQVGVGDALRWPSDARTAAVWSIITIAGTMMASGLIIRHGERSGKQPRFTRLGL